MDEFFFRTFFNNHVGTIIILVLSLSFIAFLINIYLLIFRRKYFKKIEKEHISILDTNLYRFESRMESFVDNSLENIDEATDQLEKIARDEAESLEYQIKKGKNSFTDALEEFKSILDAMQFAMNKMNKDILSVSNENKQLNSLIKEKEGRLIKQNYHIEKLRKQLKSKPKKGI